MTEIETDRLLLRMYKPDDLDDLSRIYADADVMQYLSGHAPYSLRPVAGDDTRTSFSRAFDERKREWKNAKAAAE